MVLAVYRDGTHKNDWRGVAPSPISAAIVLTTADAQLGGDARNGVRNHYLI